MILLNIAEISVVHEEHILISLTEKKAGKNTLFSVSFTEIPSFQGNHTFFCRARWVSIMGKNNTLEFTNTRLLCFRWEVK